MGTLAAWKTGADGKPTMFSLTGDLLSIGQETFDILLQSDVERFTFRDTFELEPKRICGEYRYESAVAVLDKQMTTGPKQQYQIDIRFESVEDARKLYTLIRAGHAWPDFNYEDAQMQPTLKHAWHLMCKSLSIIRRKMNPFSWHAC